MSERTSMHLTIHNCPASQVPAVLKVIDEVGLHLEFVEAGQPADDQLGLGLDYMDDETNHEAGPGIADELQRVAPGATWQLWWASCYENLGRIYRFTPALGLWTAATAVDETPLFTDQQVIDLIGHGDWVLLTGSVHQDALNRLARDNAGVILTPTAQPGA